MKSRLTQNQLLDALNAGTIVPMTSAVWAGMAAAFKVVQTIKTGLGGDILLVRRPLPAQRKLGWALVEEPKPGEKVIRPLASEEEARALIADRLAAYERMWDG